MSATDTYARLAQCSCARCPRFAPRFWALTWAEKYSRSPPQVLCSRSRAVHSDSISTIPISRNA